MATVAAPFGQLGPSRSSVSEDDIDFARGLFRRYFCSVKCELDVTVAAILVEATYKTPQTAASAHSPAVKVGHRESIPEIERF